MDFKSPKKKFKSVFESSEEMKQRRYLMNEYVLLLIPGYLTPVPQINGSDSGGRDSSGPFNLAITSNTHALTASSAPANMSAFPPKLLTFVLRLRAGDDPLDQAALHEGLSREAWLLPLPRILHPAGRGLHAVGISQQAVDHLAIHLERERESKGGGELGSACKFKDGPGS